MSKCIRCGYCCRVDPCPYGEWDSNTGTCAHLEVHLTTPEFNLYRCGLYAQILAEDDNAFSPGFGVGCAFEYNEDRRRIACSRDARIDWSALDAVA